MKDMKIAVIGAGQMGAGIAQVCAEKGFSPLLFDIDIIHAQKGLEAIGRYLHRKEEKGKLHPGEAETILARVRVSDDLAVCADCDMVIEAVSENLGLKKQLIAQLDKVLKPDCTLASNTSTYSITSLASDSAFAERIVGMHFFIPAPSMELVEVTEGLRTAPQHFDTAMELASALGKTPVHTADSAGFFVNRLLIPMWNEAAYLVMEGNKPEDIDTAMKLGAHLPMGPLELADMTGLDVALAAMQEMFVRFGDSKYRPCPLLKQMVEAGYLGRKSGRGFYDYKK